MNKKIYIVIIMLLVISLISIPTSIAKNKKQTATSSFLTSAGWSVTLEQTGVNNNLTVIPGTTDATYTLNVKSTSEVDVKYSIVLNNLPSGIEVSINGTDFLRPTNGTITFNDAGTILYDAVNKTNSHNIVFRGLDGASAVNNQTVSVDVIAEQISAD